MIWSNSKHSLIAVSFLMSSCAGVGQSVMEASMFYRDFQGPSADSPHARIRLSADGALRITPNSSCADFMKPETGVALFSTFSMKDYSHLHGRQLGMQGEAPAGLLSTEIRLKANEPAVITFTRSWQVRGTAYSCHVHQQIRPEANAQYQLLAVPLFDEGRCSVKISSITAPLSVVPVSDAQRCAG